MWKLCRVILQCKLRVPETILRGFGHPAMIVVLSLSKLSGANTHQAAVNCKAKLVRRPKKRGGVDEK